MFHEVHIRLYNLPIKLFDIIIFFTNQKEYKTKHFSSYTAGRDMWMTLVSYPPGGDWGFSQTSEQHWNSDTVYQEDTAREQTSNIPGHTPDKGEWWAGLSQHQSTARRLTQINTSISLLTTKLPINKLKSHHLKKLNNFFIIIFGNVMVILMIAWFSNTKAFCIVHVHGTYAGRKLLGSFDLVLYSSINWCVVNGENDMVTHLRDIFMMKLSGLGHLWNVNLLKCMFSCRCLITCDQKDQILLFLNCSTNLFG